jgi:hypothetical protein
MFDIEAIKKQFEGLELPNFKAYTEEEVKAKNRNNKAPFGIDTVFQSPKQILENIKGIVFDMSNEEYHSEKQHDSSSRIKAVNITDWHFVNYDKIKPKSSAFAWGNLVHDDIESRTKTGNWKQWKKGIFKTITKIDNDKLEVHASKMELIEQHRKDFERHPILSQLISKGCAEVSCFDSKNMKKIRLDNCVLEPIENALHIFDWKSTSQFEWFKNQIKKLQYDLSAGMYSTVLQDITGLKVYFHFVKVCTKTGLTQIVPVKYDTLLSYQELYKSTLEKVNGVDFSNPKGYGFEVI